MLRIDWVMRAGRPMLAAALVALLAPQAAAQASLEDLRYRVGALEAQIASLRAQSGAGASGGMLERLDRLEQQIRELTGEVEEIAHRQRQIAEDARSRFGQIEFRLTELEGGDVSALGPPPPLGGIGAAEPTGGAQSAVSVSEREELDKAIADVEAGRHAEGERALERFLRTYGDSPLRAEALFWLGEAQLQGSAPRDAARSFLQAYNAGLEADTAPRALYRLGVSLGRLGQTEDACLTLAEVPTQFPNAPEALLQDVAEESDRLLCG